MTATGGVDVGVFSPDVTIPEPSRVTTRLASGDLLLLYTDGITEAQDRYGDFFGEHRLMDALRSQHGRPADAVLESVMGALNWFTGDAPRQDDRALVVLARK